MYLGKKLVGENSNKLVGAHIDCIFDNNRKQSEYDSTRGDHLTAILTYKYPHKLLFVRCSKNTQEGNKVKWKENKNPNDYVSLENNSLFVLFPEDEKPTSSSEEEKHVLRKTKHGVKFNGKIFSFLIALVFRSVTKTSLFHSTGGGLPNGTFHSNSVANVFKKDSWCWARVNGSTETEDNVNARQFLDNKQKKIAFDDADLKFDSGNVLTCAHKLLNELRKFAKRST